MKQRGRKSISALVVTPMALPMLDAPSDLSPDEARVWCRIVASKPSDWWDEGSVPLLCQYARAVVQSETVAELVRQGAEALKDDPDELRRYAALRKIQATLSSEMNVLARAMRLTQRARYDREAASTAAKKAARTNPWRGQNVIEG